MEQKRYADLCRAASIEAALFLGLLGFCCSSVVQGLDILQSEQRKTPGKKGTGSQKSKGGQAYVVMWNLRSMFSRNHGSICDCTFKKTHSSHNKVWIKNNII